MTLGPSRCPRHGYRVMEPVEWGRRFQRGLKKPKKSRPIYHCTLCVEEARKKVLALMIKASPYSPPE